MRVLVVEDHAKLAMAVAAGLRREGMAVDVAFDGHDALGHAASTDYEVIVLDRDIPGVHGDEVCRQLIDDGCESRVLMLTAAGTIKDRVEGLQLGADDYLPKPFDFSELVARIQALARRSRPALPPMLVCGDLQLDSAHRVATRAGHQLALSPKEFAVLELLLGAGGAVVSAEQILERVWDEAADPFSQAVKTTMSRLQSQARGAAGRRDGCQSRLPGRWILMRPLPRISKMSASIVRRRTVRLRLTLLYSALFIASGAALVAIANVLVSYQLGSPVRVKSTPGSIPSTPGVIHAPPGDSLQVQQAADLHQFLVWSWIALGMMAIVSIALGWLVAGRVLRPVRIMTASAREISEHNLHERLALQGPRDEFKDLADTIDGLLARLEGAFNSQKRFVANASHELRTPVTAVRTMIQVALANPTLTLESLRATCAEVLEVGQEQEQLIEALLTLARSASSLGHRDRLDLALIARGIVQARQLDATTRGLRVTPC